MYAFLKNLRDTKDPRFSEFQTFFRELHPLTNTKKQDAKILSTAQEVIQKTKTLPEKYQEELTDFIIIEHVLYMSELFPEMSKTEIINAVFPLHRTKNQKNTRKKDELQKRGK